MKIEDTALRDTIREFIRIKRQTLVGMRERVELLNKAIPKLESEIEIEETRLGKIRADNKGG